VKGASDLQELEKDGEAIIKGLTRFLKGSPLEMDAWLKQSFDLSPCFLEDGCDKRSHLKRLGKEVIQGMCCSLEAVPPELSDSSSTGPPEGHSVSQQVRFTCFILLYSSAGLSMDANNSLSLWQKKPPTHKTVLVHYSN